LSCFLLQMLLYTHQTNSNTIPIFLVIKTATIQNNVPTYRVNKINTRTSNNIPFSTALALHPELGTAHIPSTRRGFHL
jgi:hypothetical protein